MQHDAIYWKFYLAVAVCLGITVFIHVQVRKPRYVEKNTVILLLVRTIATVLENKTMKLVHEERIFRGERFACSMIDREERGKRKIIHPVFSL